MGKNKNGDYIPPKGRPSGTGREGTGLRNAYAAVDPEVDKNLEEKYLESPDQPARNVYMRHQNRNLDKGRENQGDETT